ncbi:Hypothetical protein, putative [Bodo saltans]|uniref:Uncharacterized protein n=1 Tax=Bodo saltans TaxID=75058 RepID=A0A0S4JDJ2_BODSA|nr:Hypothetical protein, putative [Bodo saltans]|eukprot:CUG86384.1 Hypothetical protein, putative [Bodo saltans]
MDLYSKPPPNSFARLDESRAVTTPRSLIACELEGVLPDELVFGSSNSPRRRFPPGSVELQKFNIEEEFHERERRKLVDLVKKRWTLLSHPSSRMGSAKAHPPSKKKSSSPRLSQDGVISPSTRKWVSGLEKEIASDAAQAIESDLTVAKQFLRLKNNVEEANSARAALEERENAAKQRYDTLMFSRRVQAEDQARKFEARQAKVLSSRSEQQEERRERHEQTYEKLQQRLEAADKLASEYKLTKSSKAANRGGEDERLAAEKAKREKIEALEIKLESAAQAAQERRRVKELSDDIKQFQMNLKRQAMDKAQERVRRVQAYRQQLIRERELEDIAQEEERAQERIQEAKARHAAREIIGHQREAVRSYIEAKDAADEIPVPEWLSPRVKLVEQQQKAATTSSLRTPRPPQMNNSSSLKKERELISPPRDKFTGQSPRISKQQVFGKWMFE